VQRAQLLSLPISLAELEKFYTLTPADLDFIAGHRTDSNRLGIAVQLCFLRYPGRAWTPEENLPASMLRWIAEQVGAETDWRQGQHKTDQRALGRDPAAWRVHIGLNKGEARNALARAVYFNRLGELRDRTLENQQHRASGLNLVVAAIVLRNTVYLERAVQTLRNRGQMIPEALLVHLSPLKWEHINLTGDYHWRRDGGLRNRKSRPLQTGFA
jgi:TnpA family transposase